MQPALGSHKCFGEKLVKRKRVRDAIWGKTSRGGPPEETHLLVSRMSRSPAAQGSLLRSTCDLPWTGIPCLSGT